MTKGETNFWKFLCGVGWVLFVVMFLCAAPILIKETGSSSCVEYVDTPNKHLQVAKSGDTITIVRYEGNLVKLPTQDIVPCGAGL